MERKLGWLLYVGGVALGALGGTRIPLHLGYFVPGVLLVIVGTVLIRKAMASAEEGDGRAGASVQSEQEHLQLLSDQAIALDGEKADLSLEAIRERLEGMLLERALPFADGRQALIDRCGMARYAEIMGPFAQAERLLNRAWSAAVDEHRPECEVSIASALLSLEEAKAALGAASEA